MTPRTTTQDAYHGQGSAERLESWLDTQVVTGRLTPGQASAMLPDYQAPDLGPCLILIDDHADDGQDDAAEWGPC